LGELLDQFDAMLMAQRFRNLGQGGPNRSGGTTA
jgi:hypothetical protein